MILYANADDGTALCSFTYQQSQDVNFALANLHSYAKTSDDFSCLEPSTLEEENCVLLEDDLIDTDDW